MRKEKRIAVADERRKWQVLFFTKNGKPDKKRRPGKPWDKSVYAGPEKAVYTAGFGVDLLAHTKPASDLKKGSNASVEHTLGEVSLQTYLEQVNQYEQLLNPLLKIMEKNFGNASGDKPIEERGWGPEGVKLSEALEGIGALSPEFQRQKPAKKSKSFRRSNTLRNTGRMVLFNSDKQHGLLSTDASLCLEDSNAQVSNMEPSKSDVSTRYGGDGSFQATSSARSRNVIASDSDFRRSRSAMTASSDMDNQVVPFNDDVKDHYAIGEYNNKRLSKPSAAVLSAREYAEKRATKRKERKEREAKRRNPAVIPWQLLDQLDGERKKFENEKAYIEFHQKF